MDKKNARIDQNISGSLAPFTFICVITSLTAFGIVSMFSSSYDLAISMQKLPTYFFVKQTIAILIGVAVAILLQFIPKFLIKIFGFVGYILSNAVLVFSLFNSNLRVTLDLGYQSVIVIFTIGLISLLFDKAGFEKTKIGLSIIVLALTDTLLYLNNFKAIFVISIILSLTIIFYIGFKFKYFLWTLLITLIPIVLWYLSSKNRINSLLNYIEIQNKGSVSSTLAYDAIVRGGGLGQGLGKGILKLQREVQGVNTTYIFASITEELGLIGILLVAFFFVLLFILCFNSSKRLADIEEKGYSNFAFSLVVFIMLQVIFNIGVTLNILSPTLANLLPFVSYNIVYSTFLIIIMGIIYRFMRLTTIAQKQKIISEQIIDGDIVFFNDGFRG